MGKRKKLILCTALGAVLFLGGASLYVKEQSPYRIVFDSQGSPTVGEGSVHLVLFEDLTCSHCVEFSEKVLPKIQEKLIETGEIRFTLIPVSFSGSSKPLANAAISVFKTNPDQFLTFTMALSHERPEGLEAILELAESIGNIDTDWLTYAVERNLYYSEVEENLSLAYKLMGPDFGTPTLLVDGYVTSTESFSALQKQIEKLEPDS